MKCIKLHKQSLMSLNWSLPILTRFFRHQTLIFYCHFLLFFSPAEPLNGVIEGISAGMFLVVVVVGVTALLICRQKARKVWVPTSPGASEGESCVLPSAGHWRMKRPPHFVLSMRNSVHSVIKHKRIKHVKGWAPFLVIGRVWGCA